MDWIAWAAQIGVGEEVNWKTHSVKEANITKSLAEHFVCQYLI
jgi:hypothetical protein